MEQYHQQLQQAQSYYQQNPQILAPPSHSSAVRRDTASRIEKATPQTSYGPSHRPSLGSSTSNTTHISDSNRSIPGVISLPDSGYHYPAHPRDRHHSHRDAPITTTTSNLGVQRSVQPRPTSSSDVRSSISGDSATHLSIPLAQQQRVPPQSTISSGTPHQTVGAVKTPQTISTGSSIHRSDTSSKSSHQSSVINTAPGITPVSSESIIASSSSFAPVSALEPTFKATAIPGIPQAGPEARKTKGTTAMSNMDDIVADSEGEEDRDVVRGTLDDSIIAAKSMPEPAVVGLRKPGFIPVINDPDSSRLCEIGAGLVTPATDNSSSHLSVATSAPAQPQMRKAKAPIPGISEKTTSEVASTSASPIPPVSTRPKPKRRVKPVDSPAPAVDETSQKATSTSTSLPVQVTVDSASSVTQASKEVATADAGPSKKPPKTYGSKNKDSASSAVKAAEQPVSKSTDTTDLREGDEPRKSKVSKRKAIVDSESEYSEGGGAASKAQKEKKSRKSAAKQKTAEVETESTVNVPKRTGKKRAIIASDDETEDEHLQTPESKRRKASNERQPLPPPPKSLDRPRDSSVDPLDMEAGSSRQGGRLELSIELSPSNATVHLPSTDTAGGILKSVVGGTKSPNKVHFADGAANEETVPDPKPPTVKKSKSRVDDEYDEVPLDIPVVEEDDEDDFVPSGSKKAKAKAKTAKAKRGAAVKEKTVKPKKATQAKGKKKIEPSPVTEQPAAVSSDQPLDLNVPAVGKKAPKSAEVIEDDVDEPVVDESKTKVTEPVSVPSKADKPVEEKAVDDEEDAKDEGGDKQSAKSTVQAVSAKASEVSILLAANRSS
jgi:hypothetical protein